MNLKAIKRDVFFKTFALRLGFIVLILLLAGAALFILTRQIKKESSTIYSLRKEAQNLVGLAEGFSKLVKDAQLAEVYLEPLKNLVPDKSRLINFNKDIGELAAENQLEYGLVFQEETIEREAQEVNFVMTLKGEFPNFIKFLESLKYAPYYISLEGFNIAGGTPEQVASGSRTVSVNIKGKVLTKPE